jgi:hypothetical protein
VDATAGIDIKSDLTQYGISDQNTGKLDGAAWALLVETIRILESALRDPGIKQWMTRPNGYLGGRVPRDVLATGDVEKVREAADAYVRGYFI